MEEDEDVVLEGSEFHKMLQDIGYLDYEPILVNRQQTKQEVQHVPEQHESLRDILNRAVALNIFDGTKFSYLSGKQIETILQADTLLDDHAEYVQHLLNKNRQTFWIKLGEWSTLIASTVILGTSYLMQERKKTLITLLGSSLAAVAVQRKYYEFCSIQSLKNLVHLQNELHCLYKKGLRIISKGNQVKQNSKLILGSFSNIEVDRLKHVQVLTETLLTSLTAVGRIYYQSSLMLLKILPKNAFDDLLTRFENEAFNAEGEILYHQFKELYYVYLMVQSEAMQLLAVAYDGNTWVDGGRIPHSQLTRIIWNLYRLLRGRKTQLQNVIRDYENCKPRSVQRIFRGPKASRWGDLCLNLNLLSRKIATTYDTIGSILEEIDKHVDSTTNGDDEFIDDLKPRINEIYKQIDSARNFAEFSDLLMVMLKRSEKKEDNAISELSSTLPAITSDLPIIRDSDPQIIDEVFEEYITEEYLKPLYDDNDGDGLESARLDKLLAKNFMSELKEALVDKYKSMSEREAKALLRKRRGTNDNVCREVETGEVTIPCPPPLPPDNWKAEKHPIVAVRQEKREFRSPVPLPRMRVKSHNVENIANDNVVAQKLPFCIPPPPPLPPPPPEIDPSEENERFAIDLTMFERRKVPAFVTFEEEFIGSGENSEEETVTDLDLEENVDQTSWS